jgi:SAM-dependent methyltransferase
MSTETLDMDKLYAFCGRLFNATIETFEVANVYFGEKLGIYDALAETGPTTAPKLAEHLGLDERYLSEWLMQQAVAGFIDAENGTDDARARRYSISPEHAVVLTDRTSPEYLGFVGKFVEAVGRVIPQLLDGFKTGKGVSYADYGPEAVEGQAAITLPGYVNSLVQEWVPSIPGLKQKLENGARVAELASGAGIAAVTLAKAFPTITIDGFDLDETSVAIARKRAADAGVADRVTFTVQDVRDPTLTGQYDVVAVFEAVHDMGDPVPTLETLKRLAKADGIAIVVDEKVADTFTAPGDEIERFMAAASTLWCLPQGLADGPNAHGTMMRTPELTAYARTAGWSDLETLSIEHPSWKFYRLVA